MKGQKNKKRREMRFGENFTDSIPLFKILSNMLRTLDKDSSCPGSI